MKKDHTTHIRDQYMQPLKCQHNSMTVKLAKTNCFKFFFVEFIIYITGYLKCRYCA